MCTVTYLPTEQGYIITSNRDEQKSRPNALFPQTETLGGQLTMFPKDAKAGGTWIATVESGLTAVLLNGAFVAHTPTPPYAKSRGQVFLELLGQPQPVSAFQDYQLHAIEPFTLIFRGSFGLYECRWDGENKHYKALNTKKTYIWSSATLYDAVTVQKRENWFETWLASHQYFIQKDILKFHSFTGDGDPNNDLLMNRNGQIYTVSITSVEVDATSAQMHYQDLQNQQVQRTTLPLVSQSILISAV